MLMGRLTRRAPAALQLPRRTFKIYTRTGDKGESSLFNGQRRRKDSNVFAALGDSDELNAALGLASAHCLADGGPRASHIIPHLGLVQSRLLDLGSAIATPLTQSSEKHLARASFDDGGHTASQLEDWMDAMDAELPQLRNFILPGGGVASASLHVARAICRRAERSVVPLVLEGECEDAAAIYLNRLSDYLFVAARYVAVDSGGDSVYQKPKQ
jgi:cob(I)alamin adenosyltransferase